MKVRNCYHMKFLISLFNTFLPLVPQNLWILWLLKVRPLLCIFTHVCHTAHSFAKVLTNTQRFYKRTWIAFNLHFCYFHVICRIFNHTCHSRMWFQIYIYSIESITMFNMQLWRLAPSRVSPSLSFSIE